MDRNWMYLSGLGLSKWRARLTAVMKRNIQLQYDGTRWRKEGEMKGKLANAVGSQYPSHYLGTWCIQHYYRWCAHLCCQQSTELTPTGRFKWTRPFHRKTKSGFCACAITFQLACTNYRFQCPGISDLQIFLLSQYWGMRPGDVLTKNSALWS